MGHSAGYLHSKYPAFYNPDGSSKVEMLGKVRIAKPPEDASMVERRQFVLMHRMRAHLTEYLAILPASMQKEDRAVIEDFLDWLEDTL